MDNPDNDPGPPLEFVEAFDPTEPDDYEAFLMSDFSFSIGDPYGDLF